MSREEFTTVETLIDWFNEEHPVGTRVTVWPATTDGRAVQTKTRSVAWALGSGEPVVAVEGIAGGVHLGHVICERHPWHAREAADV